MKIRLLLSSVWLLSSCVGRVPRPPQPPAEEPAPPIVCDDGNACTVDANVDDACAHNAEPDGAWCAQNDCASTWRCEAGVCVATAVDDGAPCDDGNACTVADTCEQQQCASGAGSGGLALSPGVVVADTSQFPRIWDRRGDIVLWSYELDTSTQGLQTSDIAIIPRAFVRTNAATGVSVPVVDNGFFDTTFIAALDDNGDMWSLNALSLALWRIDVDQTATLMANLQQDSAFALDLDVRRGAAPVVDIVAWVRDGLGSEGSIIAARVRNDGTLQTWNLPVAVERLPPALSIHDDNADAFRATLIKDGVIELFTFQPSGEIDVAAWTFPVLTAAESFISETHQSFAEETAIVTTIDDNSERRFFCVSIGASTRVTPLAEPLSSPLLDTTPSGDVLITTSTPTGASLLQATSPSDTRVLDSVDGSFIGHLDDDGVVVLRAAAAGGWEIAVHDFECR
jgi:hypothetical protein